jgi:hypothetical protein
MTPLTFLMDSDPKGSTNQFYTLAAKYFSKTPPYPWAVGQHTLEEVFTALRAARPAPTVINIVAHATGFGSLSFPLSKAALAAGRGDTIGIDDLSQALQPTGSFLPALDPSITESAIVTIYGCDVGRDSLFIRLLGLLFGRPASITAPRRVATFFTDTAGDAAYGLSQSWSVPSIWLPAMPTSPTSPQWPAFRAQFVDKASSAFAGLANRAQELGSDILKTKIQTLAATATATSGDPEFFTEGIFGLTKADVDTLVPFVNANPAPTGAPLDPALADDAWQATRLTSADAVLQPGSTTKWDVAVTVLTTLMTPTPEVADWASYCTWWFARAIAPGKQAPLIPANPPTNSSSVPSGPSGDLGSLTDQLVAAGLAQSDLDSLLAALAPPAAGDDDALASADPEIPPTDDPDDDHIDQQLPVEDL